MLSAPYSCIVRFLGSRVCHHYGHVLIYGFLPEASPMEHLEGNGMMGRSEEEELRRSISTSDTPTQMTLTTKQRQNQIARLRVLRWIFVRHLG